MRRVWIVSHSIFSPLGLGSEINFEAVLNSRSAVEKRKLPFVAQAASPVGIINREEYDGSAPFFEYICRQVIDDTLARVKGPLRNSLFILSTTKGNIDLLSQPEPQGNDISLHASASRLAAIAGINDFRVISNACISGVLSIIAAKRYIEHGFYDHVLVTGADILSSFVFNGFASLHALSTEACRPFDEQRNGINLGEGAGALLLTCRPEELRLRAMAEIKGAGVSNDANHISGPSRTGAELAMAVSQAIERSDVKPEDIDFLNAHGTATLYNDEMEALAFSVAGLANTPVNSLKGYYGHTLGAAGVIETIISIMGMNKNIAMGTRGYARKGVSASVNILEHTRELKQQRILKTASGFGGCNAAVVLQKT